MLYANIHNLIPTTQKFGYTPNFTYELHLLFLRIHKLRIYSVKWLRFVKCPGFLSPSRFNKGVRALQESSLVVWHLSGGHNQKNH